MLQEWIRENLLLCGMVATGVFGLLCVAMVNHFYSRAMRDLHRIKDPKGKWTREFLNEYKSRISNHQRINNPEVFIRTQMLKGKVGGVTLQKWKQGIGWGAMLCFLLMIAEAYHTYLYQESQLLRNEYLFVGAGIFVALLLMKQFMGFFGKEDMILDGLLDYMENMSGESELAVNMEDAREQVREELINRVTEGISQTAASQNKFSHMLTSEEEKIVREVIREYLT